MDGHGLRFARWAHAAEGWLPLAALAGSAWLFYAASDLDAVSTAVAAPKPACESAAAAAAAADCPRQVAGR